MFRLPELPYGYDALAPVISQTTMETHHGKHHRKYIDTLNELIAKGDAPQGTMEEIVRAAGPGKVYNNAGQSWNHAFFWESMTPDSHQPGESWREPVASAFGDWSKLREAFVTEGANHFASGWVWLTWKDGALAVTSTHDGESFDRLGDATPLLLCDVWEHAYYLDHKQDRKGFLEQWFDELANWNFAERQLEAAKGQGTLWRFPDTASGTAAS